MVKIEERARQYATNLVGGEYVGGFKGNAWLDLYSKYIEIATEQHKIDIEKAREYVINDKSLNRWFHTDIVADELSKAMEE